MWLEWNPASSQCTPGENGVPLTPAGTLAVIGDLKQMDPYWLVGLSYIGYGATMAVV